MTRQINEWSPLPIPAGHPVGEPVNLTARYVNHEGQVDQRPDRFGQSVEIVAAVPDDTDPHPTCDWFRIRFVDGHEMEVAPEELDPIPPVGFGRKTNR